MGTLLTSQSSQELRRPPLIDKAGYEAIVGRLPANATMLQGEARGIMPKRVYLSARIVRWFKPEVEAYAASLPDLVVPVMPAAVKRGRKRKAA